MKKFKRRTLTALLAIGVTLGLVPAIAQASFTMPGVNAVVSAAAAAEPVTYIDKNGEPQTCEDYTPLSQVADTADGTTGEVDLNGWYVVDQDVTFSTRLRAEGELNLILCDDVRLTTDNGIHVPESGVLNIYGQSVGTGVLSTGSDESDIGTDTVNSPLGGNTDEEECGTITINGGTIDAFSNTSAPAIGSGGDNVGGRITCGLIEINGGRIYAKNSAAAPAIGNGLNSSAESPGEIRITGGYVKAAYDGHYPGLFDGLGSVNECYAPSLSITGGTVIASTISDSDNWGAISSEKNFTLSDNMKVTAGSDENSAGLYHISGDDDGRVLQCRRNRYVVVEVCNHPGTKFTTTSEGHSGTCDTCIFLDPEVAFPHTCKNGVCTVCGYEITTWGRLQEQIYEAGDGDTITLTDDYTAQPELSDTALVIPASKSITLDLGRFTLDRGLSGASPVKNGNVITNSGTLTLTGTGTVTGGNNSGDGGGIVNYSIMTMSGGTISGNIASLSGGGIYNWGRMDLNGGTITGNAAKGKLDSGWGGGVLNNGKLNVSGSPVITDNTGMTGNDLFLRKKSQIIYITGEMTDSARIGVRTETEPGVSEPVVFTSGLNGKGTAANFTADFSDGFVWTNSGGEAYLGKVIAPKAQEHLICNGSSQSLISAGSVTSGTMSYAVTTEKTAPDTGEYSTSIPERAHGGVYYVWYRAVNSANNEEVYAPKEPIIVTIEHGSLSYVKAIPATCETDGSIGYWKCDTCGTYYRDAEASAQISETDIVEKALGHDWGDWEVTRRATLTEQGEKKRTCKRDGCGEPQTEVIPKLINIKGATVSGIKEKTWTGKALTQSPVVKLSGKTLKNGTDYTASYQNNENFGMAALIITGKGRYGGTITKSFKINPKGTSITRLVKAKKAVTVKWTKQAAKMSASRITGYQIQYALNKKFTKGKKVVKITKPGIVSKKVTKLKAKKKYFVRIRTYKMFKGRKYYSKWCKAKTVTTKK